jgi:hypothetical protein
MNNKYIKTCYITRTFTDDTTLYDVSVTSTSEVYVAVTQKY